MRGIFLIAGFQRSGSTYLHNLLDSHPEIKMNQPVRPEPKFFLSDRNSEEYRVYITTNFPGDNTNLMLGEKSTSYIEDVESIKRFKKIYPDGKVLLILRNPVDRAISNYKFSVENGLETRSPEEVFIKKTPPPPLSKNLSVSPFDYIQRSFYSEYIKKLKSVLNQDEYFIICFEELIQNPSEIEKIHRFLGVKPITVSENVERVKVNSTNDNHNVSLEIRKELKKLFSTEVEKLSELTKAKFKYCND